jgi:hypothetical protein
MKRGGIRTNRKYVMENGKKVTKFEIQGRKNGVWIPVVERNELKQDMPMVYNTIGEAEKKLLEIHKQIIGKKKPPSKSNDAIMTIPNKET